ncbi:MAG: ornithine cyclodeaminase family protein [Chloroflexota bacterium]|nr:ornithine cyclodeaminase family protein [Chloroflexota bacterium]
MTEADVDRLADMDLALRVIEASFERQGRGRSANVGRRRARTARGALQLMGAADPDLGVLGAKLYPTVPGGGISFVVVLFDAANGSLSAVIEAGRLSGLRTGAASGVSVKYLAPPEVQAIGIIGTGRQARTQLEAVCAVQPSARVRVFSRDPANVQQFIEETSPTLPADLEPAATAEAAVRGAQVVITATNAADPVIEADWIGRGAHIIAMGTNHPQHRELDSAAVARADRVFVDDLEGAKIECGDLICAVEDGAFQWGEAVEFGQVVAGRAPGRTSPDEVTLFESQGIALWDIALGQVVLERAVAAGVGTCIGD